VVALENDTLGIDPHRQAGIALVLSLVAASGAPAFVVARPAAAQPDAVPVQEV
jgi:hypothetical protein